MNESPTPAEIELYRIENPRLSSPSDGTTSHEDLVGQWFTPNLDTALNYLRKSTQTFGADGGPVDGAQMIVAHVPADQLEAYHVSLHPVAKGMDVENDNYILPRDGSIAMETMLLDEVLGELRGRLGNIRNWQEAKQRLHQLLQSSHIRHLPD